MARELDPFEREVAVWRESRCKELCLRAAIVALIAAVSMLAIGARALHAQGSAGPDADSCTSGPAPVPAPLAAGPDDYPKFPEGQFPVKLPAVSLLGAPNDLPNPYNPGVNWGQLPAGRLWGSTASVTSAPDGTIWVADRCGHVGATGPNCAGANANVNPIFQFDTSGKLLKSFGAGLLVNPHKLEIDRDGNLWIADNGGDQVFKLDPNGKVLMTLGKKGVVGSANDEFDAPTDIAFGAGGTFFISDGHTGGGTAIGNARILKFDKNGKFLMSWGKKGMGPGEFDLPHTMAMDSKGRLYVGDRQNNRIQIFDQNGKFIAQWFQFGRPSGIYIDRNDVLYVTDSESRDGRTNIGHGILAPTGYGFNAGAERGIRIGSTKDGRVKYFIPDPCPYPYASGSDLAEGITADADGNIYGADYRGDVRKFTKKSAKAN